jgi:hypothetical protein
MLLLSQIKRVVEDSNDGTIRSHFVRTKLDINIFKFASLKFFWNSIKIGVFFTKKILLIRITKKMGIKRW